MLTIGKLGRGSSAKEYYLQFHEEDYYNRGISGDPPGQWEGRLPSGFRLSGVVDEKPFGKLFHGESPTTGEVLRQRRPNERSAFDLTFSAPKSVSVVHALADLETRRAIEAAMYQAVKEGLRYIEEEVCRTRLGKNGTEVVKGEGLAVALFLHTISREEDPQLHFHAVAFNFTKGPDGQYRTLDAYQLYAHKHAAGALFRTELAARLKELGFEIEADRFSFALKGVPESLTEEFSKRSEQIRKELGERVGTPKQKDLAALKSREPKRDIDRDKLMAEWREVAARHGLTAQRISELKTGVKAKDWDEAAEVRAAVREAIHELTSRQSTFTAQTFMEQAAIQGQTRGLSANQIRLQVWGELQQARRWHELDQARRRIWDPQVVRVGVHWDGSERFTSRELYQLEREMIEVAVQGQGSTAHCVSDTSFANALAAKPTLKAEQKEVVKYVTQHAADVLCVSGWAGTGKTYAIDAARIAFEAEGYRVLGCALSGKAAKELSKGAHLKSVTVAKLIYDLDNPDRKDRLTLNSKTVLVVDEAGMVGTRALHRLITEAERAGARLVLVGDDKQLQSIEAGGGFSGLAKRLGYAELKKITRQRDPKDRRAVYDLAEGKPQAALKSYAERGRLTLGEDERDTIQRLVADWRSDKTDLKEKLILSSTNHQAAIINRLCQEERQKQGELGEASLTVGQGAKVHAGDRVLFTRNNKYVGVYNGDLGTVIKVTTGVENESRARARMLIHRRRPVANQTLTVKLDSGEVLTVALSKYDAEDIRLGYCVTTHKAQGATVENSYVFVHGGMIDAEMAYVQASRARDVTRIYTSKDEAGPELSDLAEAMSRSRKKTMAHDAVDEAPKGPHHGRGVRQTLCYEPH